MSTESTPTLDDLLLFDQLPFANLDALDFPALEPAPGLFLTDSPLVLPPPSGALLFADPLDLGPPFAYPMPPLDIANVGGDLGLIGHGLDMPTADLLFPSGFGGGDALAGGAGSVAGPSNVVEPAGHPVVPTMNISTPQPGDWFGNGTEAYDGQVTIAATRNHQLGSWLPDLQMAGGATLPAWPFAAHPMVDFGLTDASLPPDVLYPALATPGMGVPSGAPAQNLGVQYPGDANAAGPSGGATHLHDGVHLDHEMNYPAFGLYAQQYTNFTPPGQPQSVLSDIDESASSPSTSEPQSAGPSRKRGRPSNDAEDDGEGEAKRQKVKANMSLEQLLAEPRRVRFKNTPAGQLCATRHYKSGMAMPVTCFLCDEQEFPPGIVYNTWRAFTRHITSCEAKDHPERWPVCHFCGVRIHAYKRPDQMVRHMVGGQGNKACAGLQAVLRSGVKTNGALADWLVARSLPIRNEFLGKKLAKALRSALLGKQVGRDGKLNLPLVKQKAKET